MFSSRQEGSKGDGQIKKGNSCEILQRPQSVTAPPLKSGAPPPRPVRARGGGGGGLAPVNRLDWTDVVRRYRVRLGRSLLECRRRREPANF